MEKPCSWRGWSSLFYHHHHLSLNLEGRFGTTNDFTTSFLHFCLFFTALWDLPNSSPNDKQQSLCQTINKGTDRQRKDQRKEVFLSLSDRPGIAESTVLVTATITPVLSKKCFKKITPDVRDILCHRAYLNSEIVFVQNSVTTEHTENETETHHTICHQQFFTESLACYSPVVILCG